MFKEIKIRTKITALLLAMVLLSVVTISYLSYLNSKKGLEKQYAENFEVMGSLKSNQIETFFNELNYNLTFLSKAPYVVKIAETSIDSGQAASKVNIPYLDAVLRPICDIYNYKEIFITDFQQNIIYKTFSRDTPPLVGERYSDFDDVINSFTDSITFGEPFKKEDGKVYMYCATPILNSAKNLIGNIIVVFDVSSNIYPLVTDTTGLGRTGEIIISKKIGNTVKILSPLRHDRNSLLSKIIVIGDATSVSSQKSAIDIGNDYGIDTDYRGEKVLAYWQNIARVNWGIVVKKDISEINQDLTDTIWVFIQFGSVIILFSLFVSILFSKYLTSPIILLNERMQLIAKGILPEKVDVNTNDEIGKMGIAIRGLVEALKRTANFAHQIGEGNYNAEFTPMSKGDMLGNALLAMRDSISNADKKDAERTWIVSGIAEVGQLLRIHNNLEDLGNDVISYMTEKVGAIQGAFYVVEEEIDSQPMIVLKSSYAYHKKKYLKAKFKFAEGLVGQVAIEQDKIMRTEIPDNYMSITSGILGEQKPKCLLLVPLITNEKVYGVLEFAGFRKFTTTEIHFVEEISQIVARTIFNIRVNERTYKLLQESQTMSEELKFQQEILRQNAEEMEATQEELRRTNQRLEEQIQEVNRTQKRMQLLLENASEIITIYEIDGKVRYTSPSVQKILGYTPDDLIGMYDIDNIHQDGKTEFKGMFETLLKKPEEKVTIQFSYRKKDTETIWMEATGSNMLSDPAVKGIVVNSRDITERRRAEKEQRMRSQMQSLSENSPDLITRVNTEGIVFYINPVIQKLTGRQPNEFLGKKISSIDINPDVAQQWRQLMEQAMRERQKVTAEVNFPVKDQTLVMSVNVIPETNDKNDIDSLLLVSHDITESKRIESEIRNTNKKITESINYAQRIQQAILPDVKMIRDVFPDSFVFYRPRDVVSGDFPWLMQKGNMVYIAVADCTGHGVPGALISLIGYFLLRDVITAHGDKSSGEILDILNESITKTLKQDAESKTRDGMDIAFCKINMLTNELEYSGAHRPLYYYVDGQLDQYRGDKIPIGGGHHYHGEKFSTAKMVVKKGDEIYMFSDGLPDQFGGGGTSRKFSAKRIRDIIEERTFKNMEEANQVFETEFNNWKGDDNQTDDILMIGIKF